MNVINKRYLINCAVVVTIILCIISCIASIVKRFILVKPVASVITEPPVLKPEPIPVEEPTYVSEPVPVEEPTYVSEPVPEPIPVTEPTYEPEPIPVTEPEPVPEEEPIPAPPQESTLEFAPIEKEPKRPPTTMRPQPTPMSEPEPDDIQSNLWVSEHNRIRADVGQSPIVWNSVIAEGAKKHAQNCKMEHSKHTDRTLNGTILGENLSYGSPYDYYDIKGMVGLWEAEKQNYDHPQYPGQSKKGVTGHYTQIVNKNVTDIGCGCAKCDDSKFCVCRYLPIQMGDEYPY